MKQAQSNCCEQAAGARGRPGKRRMRENGGKGRRGSRADDRPNASLIPRTYLEINLNLGRPLGSYMARTGFVRCRRGSPAVHSSVSLRLRPSRGARAGRRIKAIVAEKGREDARPSRGPAGLGRGHTVTGPSSSAGEASVSRTAHSACSCRGYRAPRTLMEYASSPGLSAPVPARRPWLSPCLENCQGPRTGTRCESTSLGRKMGLRPPPPPTPELLRFWERWRRIADGNDRFVVPLSNYRSYRNVDRDSVASGLLTIHLSSRARLTPDRFYELAVPRPLQVSSFTAARA